LKRKQKILKASNKVRKVNSANPETGIIAEAARIIRNGGVVVFPTRSLYGLGADAFNVRAINRIFRIKQRPTNKPILVLIEDMDELNRLAALVPPKSVSACLDIILHTRWLKLPAARLQEQAPIFPEVPDVFR
jgi:L-threonylcarbamoyladenylate synthase